ncbi:MAG TPA: hypothetical protein VFB28_05510 [Terriglobales bacterium]|nr:hypothetical protein [Terriglobales bacterium]
MPRLSRWRAWSLMAMILSLSCCAYAQTKEQEHPHDGTPVLWVDPGDIGSRDLFWGVAGRNGQPKPPLTFVSEDLHGTNPKFDVRDADGTKWRAKLGPEARPEVVASRLLWAVGYSANENYFYPMLHVDEMPAHLRRGQKLAGMNGDVPNLRLQRRYEGLKKVGTWDWRKNPFYGTREFNGLRVMMALIRNWDLYAGNNSILRDKKSNREIYEVSDVGSAFGDTRRDYKERNSVGDLKAYGRGKLIARITPGLLDLDFPRLPPLGIIVDVPLYREELRARWIGRDIPRGDAKWIGSLLAQLKPHQVRDAFRAAGYEPSVVDSFTAIVLSRIQELNNL